MSQESGNTELEVLARNLVGLVPSTGAMDKGQLLFRAGQASTGRNMRRWRLGTVAALLAGAGIFAIDRLRPAPQPSERLVYVRVEVPVKHIAEPAIHGSALAMPSPSRGETDARVDSPFSVYRMQQTVMRAGFEGLPTPVMNTSLGPVLSIQDWRQGQSSDLLKP
jgi:hypothetical protein